MPFEGEPRARATRDPSPRFASSSNDWLLALIRSRTPLPRRTKMN